MNAWRELVEQWRERRALRLGIYALAAIVWLQGLLVWSDALRASTHESMRVSRQIARLTSEAGEVQWAQRARVAQQRVAAIDAQVVAVETLGLAQADLHDWLTAQAQRAGLPNPTIVVSASSPASSSAASSSNGARAGPEATLGLAFQVQAQIRADFLPLPAYDFMAALEKGERRIWVESLSIRPGAGGRLEMSVLAAYRQKAKATP